MRLDGSWPSVDLVPQASAFRRGSRAQVKINWQDHVEIVLKSRF